MYFEGACWWASRESSVMVQGLVGLVLQVADLSG